MVAWHAFARTRGKQRLLMVVPAAIALILNTAAIAGFARWAAQVLLP